jgi:hypothetical protein
LQYLFYGGLKTAKGGGTAMPRYVAHLGMLGVVMLIISEFINDGARYPYFVLVGESGLRPAEFMNIYMDIPLPIVYLVLCSLMLLTGVFIAMFYYALNRKLLADIPA